MSIVHLSSGGLDSTLSAVIAVEEGLEIYPLFINYGQIAKEKELNACRNVFKLLNLPDPLVTDIHDFANLYQCGLTNRNLDIFEDAFLPGRNMLFLLMGATYSCSIGASAVSIGLLNEDLSIFPDQTKEFINKANELLCIMINRNIQILTPLMEFTKKDVVALAKKKGIIGTYSCHAGTDKPCGKCIACREYIF